MKKAMVCSGGEVPSGIREAIGGAVPDSSISQGLGTPKPKKYQSCDAPIGEHCRKHGVVHKDGGNGPDERGRCTVPEARGTPKPIIHADDCWCVECKIRSDG